MQDSDMKLDEMLQQLAIEPPASNLAERIIAATRPITKATRSGSVWDVLAELLLPKPAFALAVALLMGVVVGVEATTLDMPTTDANGENFLSYEGDIL